MTKSNLKWPYFVGILLILTLPHCKAPAETQRQQISGTVIWSEQEGQVQDPNQKTIEFGMGPWYTVEETQYYMRPLLNYLEEQTGYRFILNIAENYEELVANFQNKHIDVADLSASLYDQLLREAPGSSQYIGTMTAKVGDKMTSHYQGIIFSHKDSSATSLKELKGKTFAFVDQGSSSGFKYPLVNLVKAGIEPERDFAEIFYVGNHDAVAKSVAHRQVTAGAIWDLALTNAEKVHGHVFRRLAVTSPIPREAWIAQNSMSPEFIQAIRQALTTLSPNTKLKSGEPVFREKVSFNGFVVESEAFYSVVGETSSVVQNYLEKYPAQ